MPKTPKMPKGMRPGMKKSMPAFMQKKMDAAAKAKGK